MTRKEQKDEEQEIAILFCNSLQVPYHIIDGAGEQPDIHMEINDKKIGLEVTDYYNDEITDKDGRNGSPGKRFKVFWDEVNEKCKEFKVGQKLDNVHVYVSLDKAKLLEKSLSSQKIIDGLAQQLVKFAHDETTDAQSDILFIPPKDDEIEKSYGKGDFRSYDFLKKYIRYVRITKNNAFFSNWEADVTNCLTSTSQSRLADIISDKSLKAKKYKIGNIDELWLLIAAAHNNPFNKMRIPSDQIDSLTFFNATEVMNACQGAPFEKIYFFAHRPDDIKESWSHQIWPSDKVK